MNLEDFEYFETQHIYYQIFSLLFDKMSDKQKIDYAIFLLKIVLELYKIHYIQYSDCKEHEKSVDYIEKNINIAYMETVNQYQNPIRQFLFHVLNNFFRPETIMINDMNYDKEIELEKYVEISDVMFYWIAENNDHIKTEHMRKALNFAINMMPDEIIYKDEDNERD